VLCFIYYNHHCVQVLTALGLVWVDTLEDLQTPEKAVRAVLDLGRSVQRVALYEQATVAGVRRVSDTIVPLALGGAV